MKVVIAVINRASDLRFFTELKLQTSSCASAAFEHAHRHARLILPAEARKELINDMNNRGHSDLLQRFELLERLKPCELSNLLTRHNFL
jgi:hypothetical protein